MKKKILTLGMVLALVSVLVMPTAALATTTDVTGDVVAGYTFTAPSAIALGSMTPGTAATGDSAGWLEGNNALGYKVDGVDTKGTDTGKMVSGANVLTDKLKMGATAAVPNDADVVTSFLGTDGITDRRFHSTLARLRLMLTRLPQATP